MGITYTQYLVLLVLWENDEQPVNTIGQRLKLGINTTSPLIKRMEKLGLVARHDSEVDKRQQIVYLTDKGKAMKEQAAKIPRCMTGDLEKCGIDTHLLVSMIPALDNIIRTLSGVTATDADE